MKTNFLLLAAVVAAVVAAGCTGTRNLARELSKDNATVVLNIGTVYGTAKIVRTNPGPGQSATISPDGSVTITPLAMPGIAPSALPASAPQRALSPAAPLPMSPGGNLAPVRPFQTAN
jgi:hypothetical protein